MEHSQAFISQDPLLSMAAQGKPVIWINPKYRESHQNGSGHEKFQADRERMEQANQRLFRFASLISHYFPETKEDAGLIESPLYQADKMKDWLIRQGSRMDGRLMIKLDSQLPVAGSVKARGGIYEILFLAERLATEHGLLTPSQDYIRLSLPDCQALFGRYHIHVGSTGNLGLSIGIISARLGFQVTVHMSRDARQWKKDLLREKGAQVMEYDRDYSFAVSEGRRMAQNDPMAYFVDDENSQQLFWGYSTAAFRLRDQLQDQQIKVDDNHPLFVYLPCGVGGAPGGIAYGLKQLWGHHVHCFFVEPVQAPCMLLGLATGLHQQICVQDLGLTGQTEADGLAVSRASGFVGRKVDTLISGALTLEDEALYRSMKALWQTEQIFVEPSGCAGFQGPLMLLQSAQGIDYCKVQGLLNKEKHATHIVWATGGALVPEIEKLRFLDQQ